MREVGRAFCIQLTITNACSYDCCHCSQSCPHVSKDKKYYMTLDEVEKGLQSLEGFNGHIGIFGGEPTIHPQFEEICKLYQKYVFVKARRELWTAGTKYKKYKELINETFYPELVSYNEHWDEQSCYHQPVNIAVREIFNGETSGHSDEDRSLMKHLINNCWVQQRWSPAITPKGAYFCEIAGSRAIILGGANGLPVEKGWWLRPLGDYQAQIDTLCVNCSACVPMFARVEDKQERDEVSPKMLAALREAKSPKAVKGNCIELDLEKIRAFLRGHSFNPETEYRKRGGYKDFPNWKPWSYRLQIINTPDGGKIYCGKGKELSGANYGTEKQ